MLSLVSRDGYAVGMLANGKNPLRRVAVLAIAAVALVLSAPATLAQTTTIPYPGTATSTTSGPTEQTFNAGQRELGSTFTVSQCNFLPGATVSIVVNGSPINSVVAGADGCIRETFDVKPALVNALGAQHILAATGLAQAASKVQIAVNGQLLTVGPLGSSVLSVAKGTGFNSQPRTFNVIFTVVKRGTTDGNGNPLARTGSTILKWSPLGAGLLAVGYMLVMITKRRQEAA